MATASDDRSISIDRGDVIGSTVITGNGNIVVLQAAGMVRDEPQEARAADAKIGPNPYKGLLAFHEEDAERFFGREEQTDRLWQMFRDLHDPPPRGELPLRLLPVLGPSGSGKSSVARAGLIPELAQRPLPGWKKARVVVLTPGSHPLEALAAVLAQVATGDPAPVKKTREFVDELKLRIDDSRLSLRESNAISNASFAERKATYEHDGLRRIAATLPEIASTPLIVLVDQFEELYSLCADPDERNAFVENLLCAVSDPAANVSAIITLRTDFLGETQNHPQLNAAIAGQGAIIPAMNKGELRLAIAEPAKLAGRPLDEATVDLLIHETEGREGALPLLQFALTRIWEGLLEGVEPAETLKQIGGVGGALAGEAQRIYNNLPDAEKNIARRVFLGLVQLGEGTRDTRRRVIVTSLVAVGEDPGQVEEVVRRFSAPGVRLITLAAESDGDETAEVTHEALFEHWRQLDEWLANGRDDLRFQRRLDQAARHWDEHDRAEGLLWRPPDLTLLTEFEKRADKDVTLLQRDFFLASKQAEYAKFSEEEMQRRREIELATRVAKWLRIAIFAAGVAGVLAVVSTVLGIRALREARRANESLEQRARALEELKIKSAEAIIGRLSGAGEHPTAADFEVLKLLAESAEDVRIEVIKQLLSSKSMAMRLESRYPYVVHSVVAFDEGMRKHVEQRVIEHGQPPSEDPVLNLAAAEIGSLLDPNVA